MEEKDAEDPKFHRTSNGSFAIRTYTMERHYKNESTAGKLIATPMMSVLTWKATHTSTRSIGKQEIEDCIREGGGDKNRQSI